MINEFINIIVQMWVKSGFFSPQQSLPPTIIRFNDKQLQFHYIGGWYTGHGR